MLSPLVGVVTSWERPMSWARSMNDSLMHLGYWLSVVLSVVQSMSGRLKSPASQKVDVLYLSWIVLMSSQRVWQPSLLRSGALYAQARMRGGLLGTLIFAKTVSDVFPFSRSVLLRDFLMPKRTPPPDLSGLSRLYMSYSGRLSSGVLMSSCSQVSVP